jgi:hypothetical protein
LQQIGGCIPTQYPRQPRRQVGSLEHSDVHALHPHRPGLMGGVTDQPATVAAEFPREPALELDVCGPVKVLDARIKPRGGFGVE